MAHARRLARCGVEPPRAECSGIVRDQGYGSDPDSGHSIAHSANQASVSCQHVWAASPVSTAGSSSVVGEQVSVLCATCSYTAVDVGWRVQLVAVALTMCSVHVLAADDIAWSFSL